MATLAIIEIVIEPVYLASDWAIRLGALESASRFAMLWGTASTPLVR